MAKDNALEKSAKVNVGISVWDENPKITFKATQKRYSSNKK